MLKSAHDTCSDLNIIQGGREAHILLYSPWARGVGPRSLIKIETAIYIYIYIYIAAQGIWCPFQHLAHPIPGRDFFFEYDGLFINVIQYNVRIFFGGGLRRNKFEYL